MHAKSPTLARTLVLAALLGLSTLSQVAQAGMFDMINPSRWFDNDRDYYGGPYGGGPYGYGPYGYGGPYGYPGGYGPYGYPGGYGPYGYGGYPGYGPSTIVVNPGEGQQRQEAPRLPE